MVTYPLEASTHFVHIRVAFKKRVVKNAGYGYRYEIFWNFKTSSESNKRSKGKQAVHTSEQETGTRICEHVQGKKSDRP
jgi:hypothetical protein